MNAPISTSEPPGPFDLAGLGAPGRLARAARLYAIVLDRSGHPGPRQFLASLPEGAAVFALAAPGRPLRAARAGGIVAGAADRQCNARRHRHRRLVRGAARRTGTAPWRCRDGAAGAGRQPRLCRRRLRHRAPDPVARIGSADPALSRRRRHARHRLPRRASSSPTRSAPRSRPTTMCRHIDTEALLARLSPAALGEPSAPIACRIAAALTRRDANRRQRWQQTREIDEVRAAHALKGLRDVVLFRPTAPILVARAWPGSAARRARRAGRRRRLRAQDAAARPRAHAAVRAAEGLCLRQRLRLPRDRARRRLVAPAGPALHRRRGQDGPAARHGVPRAALARRRSRDARRDGGRRRPGGAPQAHGLHALRAAAGQTEQPRHLALLDIRRCAATFAAC